MFPERGVLRIAIRRVEEAICSPQFHGFVLALPKKDL